MKLLMFIPLVLASMVAEAQTTSQTQIRHVETSLNHLTVLEFGEPVTTLAIADPDSFRVEQHDDKVFIEPLRQGVATNLFVWTGSRQLSYELDPAGELASMDVLIRVEPAAHPHISGATISDVSDAEIHRIASVVLAQEMVGAQEIAHDPFKGKPMQDQVEVELDQVYRTKDQLYIRYTVTNETKTPFRLTTPDVSTPLPSEQPISLLSLKNHQLSPQVFESFRVKPGASIAIVQSESAIHDLAPGQKTTGVISVGASPGNAPQLYELNFGSIQDHQLTVEAVL